MRFWKLAIGGGLNSATAAAKLQLVPVHSMEMADEVLATCLTRDGKLVCVAMLDSTVKVRALITGAIGCSVTGRALSLVLLVTLSLALCVTGTTDLLHPLLLVLLMSWMVLTVVCNHELDGADCGM